MAFNLWQFYVTARKIFFQEKNTLLYWRITVLFLVIFSKDQKSIFIVGQVVLICGNVVMKVTRQIRSQCHKSKKKILKDTD